MDGIISKLEALVGKLEKSGGSGANVARVTLYTANDIIKFLLQDIRGQLADVKKGKIDGLSSIIGSLECQLGLGPESAGDDQSLAEFDNLVMVSLSNFISTSENIGGDVANQAALVAAAFQAQRQFLSTAASSKKPADANLQKLLKPTSDLIGEIQKFRETNRRSEMFNHLSAVSESIPALGWVTVAPTPAPFVKEMKDAGMFYTNRVLKDWKEKDSRHSTWVRSWVETLTALQNFVKKYHTTGLMWNPNGGEASLDVSTPKVFTSTLASSPAKPKALPKAPRVFGKQTEKTPSKRQDGKKWLVEYFKGDREITIDGAQMNQTIYIYKCENSAVKVTGKCNNVILDSCRKTGVVFESLVSGCEIVNCHGVQVQSLGTAPLILVDKTDGCQMFLSKDSIGAEIVTAKSSEMNVMVPKDDEFVEMPIPEQFKSVINGTNVITQPTESV